MLAVLLALLRQIVGRDFRAAGYKDAVCGWISVVSKNKKDRQ
jgi:hypothetical protein